MKRNELFTTALVIAACFAPSLKAEVSGPAPTPQPIPQPQAQAYAKVDAVVSSTPAKPGNTNPVEMVVLVSDRKAGFGVDSLSQADFKFFIPSMFLSQDQGCTKGFLPELKSFQGTGGGAYRILLGLPGYCGWAKGDFPLGVIVNSPTNQLRIGYVGATDTKFDVQ